MRRFFIVIASALLIVACSSNDQGHKGIESAPVRVAKVTQESTPRLLRAVGNARASASVGIVPRVAGEIMAVRFNEGQDVVEGQPLIEIDPRPYHAALQEKKGILAKSEAQLAKARDDRRRFGKLVDNGYVSQEAYQQTATDAEALRATVAADRAAVENAALDLAYCTLKAPISGRIGALQVDKGNMVKSGTSDPIATIDAITPIYVTFSVPEANLPVIQKQMESGMVKISATPTGGEPQSGFLTLVDNSVDTRTGTIKLRGHFPNQDRRLWPGQFVEVLLPLGVAENAIIVPSRAVQTGRDESFVYVVNNDGRADYRKVKQLFEHDGKSIVEADLKPGENVVIEGQVRLIPGAAVRILD